jgi:FAD/FMN-containing dehydrogenase
MIFDDLKGIITGKILIDALSIKLYSCDASPFEVTPIAVVIPNNQEEVSALVKYAFEKKIPLIPRGSGTGTSGAALGNGIVIDLSQKFKNIISLEDGILHAECGVTIKQLSDFITHTQFRIPSAPWNEERSLGGWLSSDASGPFLLADKHPRHYVTALKVVLNDGSISWIESPTCERKSIPHGNPTRGFFLYSRRTKRRTILCFFHIAFSTWKLQPMRGNQIQE